MTHTMTLFRVLTLTLSLSLTQTAFAGGGSNSGGGKGGSGGSGGKGGSGGSGGKGGSGGNGKGGSGGSSNNDSFESPVLISIKDRKTGKTDILLTCKKPAVSNYTKRVTIGSISDPSNKVSLGCVEFDDSVRVRDYGALDE